MPDNRPPDDRYDDQNNSRRKAYDFDNDEEWDVEKYLAQRQQRAAEREHAPEPQEPQKYEQEPEQQPQGYRRPARRTEPVRQQPPRRVPRQEETYYENEDGEATRHEQGYRRPANRQTQKRKKNGNGKLYAILAIIAVLILVLVIWLISTIPGKEKLEEAGATFATTLSLFKDKYIVSLFLGILFIVGIDVGLNTTIPKLLMERTGMPVSEAGLGTSLYFAARTIGSFAGAFLLAKLSGARFLKYSMFVAIAAFVLLLLVPDMWSMFVMIVIVGLACANVFSIIFSYALQHKPERANEISALMIMGVSGGALITPLMGIVADGFGQVAGLSILLLCILYICIISFRIDKK